MWVTRCTLLKAFKFIWKYCPGYCKIFFRKNSFDKIMVVGLLTNCSVNAHPVKVSHQLICVLLTNWIRRLGPFFIFLAWNKECRWFPKRRIGAQTLTLVYDLWSESLRSRGTLNVTVNDIHRLWPQIPELHKWNFRSALWILFFQINRYFLKSFDVYLSLRVLVFLNSISLEIFNKL